MLKKASSLKGGNLMTRLQTQTSITSQQSMQAEFSSRAQDDLSTNRLTSQFGSASLESPAPPMINENSNDFQAFEEDSFPMSNQPPSVASVSTRIITAANVTNRSTRNDDLNDSLDMLE